MSKNILTEILNEGEIKHLKEVVKDISKEMNKKEVKKHIKQNSINLYISDLKKRLKNNNANDAINKIKPIYLKLFKQKKVWINIMYQDELIPHDIAKSTYLELLFKDYLNSFKKKDQPKIFLLTLKFFTSYHSMIQHNVSELSSIIDYDDDIPFEKKVKNFTDFYPKISENIYKYFIMYLIDCEKIRSDKKIVDNSETRYGSLIKNCKKLMKYKKYEPLINFTAYQLRNAINHGNTKPDYKAKKLSIYDTKNKLIYDLTEKKLDKELKKLIDLAYNYGLLTIMINYLHKSLKNNKIYSILELKLDELLKNKLDSDQLTVLLMKNKFFLEINKNMNLMQGFYTPKILENAIYIFKNTNNNLNQKNSKTN